MLVCKHRRYQHIPDTNVIHEQYLHRLSKPRIHPSTPSTHAFLTQTTNCFYSREWKGLMSIGSIMTVIPSEPAAELTACGRLYWLLLIRGMHCRWKRQMKMRNRRRLRKALMIFHPLKFDTNRIFCVRRALTKRKKFVWRDHQFVIHHHSSSLATTISYVASFCSTYHSVIVVMPYALCACCDLLESCSNED